MPSQSDLAFNSFLRTLGSHLRKCGFKRFGQRFGRESSDVWQTIGVQKSLYSAMDEKQPTINFGIAPKSVLQFRGEPTTRAPRAECCSMHNRITFVHPSTLDKWWTITDDESAAAAEAEINKILDAKLIPFLDSALTLEGLLDLWAAGLTHGFEIERDEARLVVLAARADSAAAERLIDYSERWLSTAANSRALEFIRRFRTHFP